MLQLVPILLLICYLVTTVTFLGNLFFDKSEVYINKKRKRGATLSTQGVYKGLGGRGKERKKLKKTDRPRGQPARCPRENGIHKEVEKILDRPRGVLETPKVSLTPNTPHNTERDHFPNDGAPGTTARPPACQKLLNRTRHNPIEPEPNEEGVPQGSCSPTMKKEMINRFPIRFTKPASVHHHQTSSP
jgi:hypothetical protein